MVAAIFVVLAGVAGVWLALDRRPPEWDHANHLGRVVNCAAASFAFSQFGPDVRARVRILPGCEGPIVVAPELVSVGGVTIPSRLVNWVVRNYDPSPVIAARAPVPFEVGPIEISPDAIRIVASR